MTMSDIVQTPIVGQVYLVRGMLGGRKTSRFQAAVILKREKNETSDSIAAEYCLTVRWIGETSPSLVQEHYGSVKKISGKWMRDEMRIAQTELELAENKALAIKDLLTRIVPHYDGYRLPNKSRSKLEVLEPLEVSN